MSSSSSAYLGKCDRCEKAYYTAFLVCSTANSNQWICHRCSIKDDISSYSAVPFGSLCRDALEKAMPGPDLFPDIFGQVLQPQIETSLSQSQALVVRAYYRFDGTVPDHPIMREHVFWEEFCCSEYILKTEKLVVVSVGMNTTKSAWMLDFYIGRDAESPLTSSTTRLEIKFKTMCATHSDERGQVFHSRENALTSRLASRKRDRDTLYEKKDEPKPKKLRVIRRVNTSDSDEDDGDEEDNASLSPSY